MSQLNLRYVPTLSVNELIINGQRVNTQGAQILADGNIYNTSALTTEIIINDQTKNQELFKRIVELQDDLFGNVDPELVVVEEKIAALESNVFILQGNVKSINSNINIIKGNISALDGKTQYLFAPYSGSGVEPTSYFLNGLQVWNGESEAGNGIFSYKDGSNPNHQIELKTESSKNIKLGGGNVIIKPKSTGGVNISNDNGNFTFQVGDRTKSNFSTLSKTLINGAIDLKGSGTNGISIYDEPFLTSFIRRCDMSGQETRIFGTDIKLEGDNGASINMGSDINLFVSGGSSPNSININVGECDLNKIGKINIGTSQGATELGYKEITIGQNSLTTLRTSSTFLDGDVYVGINPVNPQLYDYMLYAGLPSIYGGALRGKIKTTFTPYFKSLSCFSIEPTINSFVQSSGTFTVAVGLGAITLNAGLGGCLINAAAGLIGMTALAGGITATTAGGGIALTSGAGACAITTGAGPIQFQTSSGDIIIDSGSKGLSGSTYITPKEYLVMNPEESIIIGSNGNKPIYTSLIDTNYQFYGNIFTDAGVLGNLISSNIFTTGSQPVYLRPSTTAQIQLAANVAANLTGNVSMHLLNKDTNSTIYISSASVITPDSTYATFGFGDADLPLPNNANIQAGIYVIGNIQNYRYKTWEANANIAGSIGTTVNAVIRPAVNSSSHFVNIFGNVRFENEIDTIAPIEITSQSNQNKTTLTNNSITTTGTVQSASLLTNSITPITTLAITANTVVATDYFQGKALKIDPLWNGSTTNALYNVEGILYFNGAKVDSGGGSGGGGIDYYIPLATNITNPAPNPTTQIMDDVYNSNPTRTIAQSTTAVATGLLMARYTSQVFNKDSNPVLTGLQTVQQWLTWSENNVVGQIYGRLYYEAYISNNNILYDKKYTDTVSTTYATVVNGTPIISPVSLFQIQFQTVLFQFIDVDVTGTSCIIKCRLESQDLITENWSTIQESTSQVVFTQDILGQVVQFTGENFSYNQTSTVNAPPRYRVSLYVSNGGGLIRQTVAGGTDLGAYQLGSSALGTARIRVLLYDGTNQKRTVPHSTEPILFPLELPVAVPYNISAFSYSRLSFDIYMFQPSGAVNANHIMTFYYNDGAISHVETSINLPPEGVPNLSQVMQSGSQASTNLDMGGFTIGNVSSITNWNVKEITAGTNITRGITNGNYTITNSAPVQDINNNGTNITVSKTSNVATITNNAPVQDIGNTGTNISVSITSNKATITNTAPVQDIGNTGTNISVSIDSGTKTATINNTAPVQNIAAGVGIDVQINTTTKTATITNLGVSGQATRDEDQALVEVGALPRKPDYWATNWVIADNTVTSHLDMYVSVDGQVIVSASGYFNNRYSRDYGTTWNNGNVNVLWTSVCGTSQASKIFGFATFISQTQVESLVFYTSFNQGQNWTQRASATFTNLTKVNRVRCSGDGTYLVASVNNSAVGGRFLFSSNGMLELPTWTSRQLLSTLPSGRTEGVCMSRSGATQFMTWINDANTDSKIFRSFDYGTTWTEVFSHIANGNWTRIECDATGRFVWATRFVNISTPDIPAWYSDNYGSGWYQSSINGLEDMWVSATGQFVAGVSNPQGSGISYFVYSSDYGRTFIGVGNPASSVNNTYRTINGSGDGSVLVLGSSNQTESGFVGDGKIRIAREGRQNIQDLSVTGGGTIAKTGGVYTLTIPPTTIWSHTNCIDFLISQSGNLITLPNPVDLLLYDMEMQLSAMLQYDPDNPTNTLMGIYFNSFYSGKSIWTNQIHNGAEFGAAGTYSQNWLNPVFAYIPTNQLKFIQSISTNFQVSMLSNWGTPNNERPIRVRFQTSIAAGDNEALNNAYQDQAGHIQVFSKTTSFSPKTTIFNIGINQYSGGGGSSFRQSPASVPARLVIHIKRKAAY